MYKLSLALGVIIAVTAVMSSQTRIYMLQKHIAVAVVRQQRIHLVLLQASAAAKAAALQVQVVYPRHKLVV
jgi:hypothetical protein